MYEPAIAARNALLSAAYKKIFRNIFFMRDPEAVHDGMSSVGMLFGKHAITQSLAGLFFSYKNKKLEQEILGIGFKNPIGLAAGFDKDAKLTGIVPHFGFGFEEVGSITGQPCAGNPKPRLWRLKKSKSILVYYGLKNEGCEKISSRLRGKKFLIPIGTSVAKTNCKETAEDAAGIADYVKAFKAFANIGDYFTINISCPNAFGGQPFTDVTRMDKLFKEIDKIQTKKPVFLKISPDLTKNEIDAIIKVSERHRVHGFICTNVTKNRNNKKILDENVPAVGGMSGKVVENLANELISYVYRKTKDRFVIIGCGGVFSAEDAYKKIRLGASLIQMITGMIYEGPQVISGINQGLVRLLEKDGFRNISEAIGADIK